VKRTGLMALVLLAACSWPVLSLRIVCTTTIVGDIVGQICGDENELRVLLSVDVDPHAFEPTPADLVAISHADVVFLNGASLEAGLDTMLENAPGLVVSLSDELELLGADGLHHNHDPHSEDHHEVIVDPHVWFDPTYVHSWVSRIAAVLEEHDPRHQGTYRARAESYRTALDELDRWIETQVQELPQQKRKLVTDHAVFAYFAARYGFEQVGTVFPGLSSLSEPSARDLASLERTIAEFDVPVLFVGMTVNRRLAEQVAADTGIRIVMLYTGALSAADGPAGSYLDLIRYDVTAIVEALSGES